MDLMHHLDKEVFSRESHPPQPTVQALLLSEQPQGKLGVISTVLGTQNYFQDFSWVFPTMAAGESLWGRDLGDGR